MSLVVTVHVVVEFCVLYMTELDVQLGQATHLQSHSACHVCCIDKLHQADIIHCIVEQAYQRYIWRAVMTAVTAVPQRDYSSTSINCPGGPSMHAPSKFT